MTEQQSDYVIEALELLHGDLEPKKIVQEISGFTPLFDAVVNHYQDETRAAVHGAMWRFCQMEDGVCRASLNTIGELIGVDISTVSRHAEELVKDGYFRDLTPDLRNRPHVYVDTGKVIMVSKLTAGFAQSKVGIAERKAGFAQSKATIAESRMSKDLKKDFKKEKEAAVPHFSPADILKIEESANKTVDGYLENERVIQEKDAIGQAWRGRELCPPNYLPYGDWWHAKTKQHMYGAKGKAKINTEWLKAFKEFYEHDISFSVLDETYEAEIAWKKIISKPSELVTKAIAIQALPPTRETTEPRSPFESLFNYLEGANP